MAGSVQKPENVTILFDRDDFEGETSEGIEDLPQERLQYASGQEVLATLADNFVKLSKELETSFEKERAGLTSNFETEKNDLMQGFLIEKDVLAKQHKKEKKDLIENFMKERNDMFNKFQQQVRDIENEFRQQISDQASGRGSVPLRHRQATATANARMLDGKIFTPHEFLTRLELQDEFDFEKESIEKEFRREKDSVRKKLEDDFQRKLTTERKRHDAEVQTLKMDLEQLKAQQLQTSMSWKDEADRMETDFNRRAKLFEDTLMKEKQSAQRRLEKKHLNAIEEQQKRYEASIFELKQELRRLSDHAEYSNQQKHSVQDQVELLRRQIAEDMRRDFDRQSDSLRKRNDKLSEELKVLTDEKYELTGKVRSLENESNTNAKLLQEYSGKLSHEYESKMRKIMSQYDKLKVALQDSEREKHEIGEKLTKMEVLEKASEERVLNAERTLSECDGLVASLRNENKTLSHEIHLLRQEKEDLKRQIDQAHTSERAIRATISKHETQVDEANSRYVMLEREKLQQEKAVSGLRKQLSDLQVKHSEMEKKFSSNEEDMNRLRKLLESERSENQRLHDRFKHDAETIRRKDAELNTNRETIDSLKNEVVEITAKISSDSSALLKRDAEIRDLKLQLEKAKQTDERQKKADEAALQKKYVNEFNKRTEYLQETYMRETENMRDQLQAYRSRVLDLEHALAISGQTAPKWHLGPNDLTRSNDQVSSHHHEAGVDFLPTRDLGLTPSASDITEDSAPKHRSYKFNGLVDITHRDTASALHEVSLPEYKPTSNRYDAISQQNLPKPETHCQVHGLPNPNRKPAAGPDAHRYIDTAESMLLPPNRPVYSLNHMDPISCNTEQTLTPPRPDLNSYASLVQPAYHGANAKEVSPSGMTSDNRTTNSNYSLQQHLDQPLLQSGSSINSASPLNYVNQSQASWSNAVNQPIYNMNKKGNSLLQTDSHHHVNSMRPTSSSPKEMNGHSPKRHRLKQPNSSANPARRRSVGSSQSSPNRDADGLELRRLLSDVRKEVCLLNQLIDDKASSINTTPLPDQSGSASSLLKHLPLPQAASVHRTDRPLRPEEVQEAKEYADLLHKQLSRKEQEAEDSKETLKRLYQENTDLHRRLDERERAMHEQESTFGDLLKRRQMLETLVERLQTKLRTEASRRRRLEQEQNAIDETSRELDETTANDDFEGDYTI